MPAWILKVLVYRMLKTLIDQGYTHDVSDIYILKDKR